MRSQRCIGGFCVMVLLLAYGFAATTAQVECTTAWPSTVASIDFPRCTQLSNDIVLRWALQNQTITFGVQAMLPADAAYFGIGLSELGSMKGADIALFNKTDSESFKLVDSHATGFVPPLADEQQSLRLLGIQNSNGMFAAAWQHLVTPCDENDLPIYEGVPVHVIWAHGRAWDYHGSTQRGGKIIDLTATSGAGNAAGTVNSGGSGGTIVSLQGADPIIKTLDLTFPVREIPTNETVYFYQYIELPNDKKYHIVAYEPITNSPLLHHGVAYTCSSSVLPNVTRLAQGGPYVRQQQDMICQQFYMLLTPNISRYDAPADTGIPMGTNNTKWVALEIHYNNPLGLSGQNDTGSGIRIYYTDQLREHDIGLITLNQFALNIPPGEPETVANVSVCPGSCTSRFKQNITLLSGFFHMHGTGKSAIARRYRDGRELSPVAELRAFDYAFQSNIPIGPDARTLQPGDALTLTCIFDSTARTNWTYGGFGTMDEMCFYWIMYYPAQENMNECWSLSDADLAVCAAETPPRVLQAFGAPDVSEALQELVEEGVLLQAPDPANGSTPFQQSCLQQIPASELAASNVSGQQSMSAGAAQLNSAGSVVLGQVMAAVTALCVVALLLL